MRGVVQMVQDGAFAEDLAEDPDLLWYLQLGA